MNRAIVEAHDRGVLTAASLMVTGEAFEEAVALARSRPRLAVGLHLVLVDGRPALPAGEVSALCDAGGRFLFRPVRTGLRLQLSRRARGEARREIRAQLERFRQTGLRLSHVDGHHHFHLHPAVLTILGELVREFDIPAIRLPFEELGLALSADRAGAAGKLLWSVVFGRLRRHGERRLRGSGVVVCDRVYGLLSTGRITEAYLLKLVPRILSDDVEIFLHPADPIPGEPLNGPPGSGRAELEAAISPAVASAIASAGFTLATPAGGPARTAG